MDPVTTAILAVIAAGATDGAKEVISQGVVDACASPDDGRFQIDSTL